MSRAWVGVMGCVAAMLPAAASGQGQARPYAPDRAGVLVVVQTATVADDDRARSIAGAFVAKGVESFVAHEMTQPPDDADRRVIRARWRLDDARRLRRRRREAEAAEAADAAIALLSTSASERAHLDLLVEALVERGTIATLVEDAATAETAFYEALALDPRYEPDPEAHPQSARRTYASVRRAARQLRFANLAVEAPRLPGARVEIDFTGPRPPPYATKLSGGRHFVSVSAPGRHPVVLAVTARAERTTTISLLPPLSGDGRARATALRAFDTARPQTVRALAHAAGLRFVLTAALTDTQCDLQLYDGETGAPVPEAQIALSSRPSPRELEAAVAQLEGPMLRTEPDALDVDEGGGWYTTWWGLGLIGVVVAGAAAGTAFALTSGGDTEYRFEP